MAPTGVDRIVDKINNIVNKLFSPRSPKLLTKLSPTCRMNLCAYMLKKRQWTKLHLHLYLCLHTHIYIYICCRKGIWSHFAVSEGEFCPRGASRLPFERFRACFIWGFVVTEWRAQIAILRPPAGQKSHIFLTITIGISENFGNSV